MTENESTALAQPTTMEEVKDRIALRIKAAFVELMPEEAWAKMIQAEIENFTIAYEHGGYRRKHYSNLQAIVREVLEKQFRKMLTVELAKPEYTAYLDGQPQPGEFIIDFLKANMSTIASAVLAGLGQSLIEKVKNSIQQDVASRY